MRARQCGEPRSDSRCEFFWRCGRARSETDYPTYQRKQILNAVIHFPEKQLLPFLRAPSLRNVPRDLRRSHNASVRTLDGGDGQRDFYEPPSFRRRTVS